MMPTSLSSSRVFAFSDPHPYQPAIRAAEVEIVVTAKGEFHSELVQIDLHRLWMQRGRESLPRVFHGTISPKRAVIVFLADRNQPTICYKGMELSPGEIVVDVPGATHHQWTRTPFRWAAMSLTPDDLAAAGHAIAGHELTVPSLTHVIRPPPMLMKCLMSLHEKAGQLAKTAPDKLAHHAVARSLEQALTHAMIRCLTDAVSVEERAASCQHSGVIARLEDFLAANEYEPVYLADVCAAIGVSERTLRVCCQEYLGMGLVRYLRLRRMHLARRALLLADPATATVTGIATEHGFWELGRFSVEYRALFGESPSTSLRRPPEDKRISRGRPSALTDSDFA
jgi:AraC-like DNA-binding protein